MDSPSHSILPFGEAKRAVNRLSGKGTGSIHPYLQPCRVPMRAMVHQREVLVLVTFMTRLQLHHHHLPPTDALPVRIHAHPHARSPALRPTAPAARVGSPRLQGLGARTLPTTGWVRDIEVEDLAGCGASGDAAQMTLVPACPLEQGQDEAVRLERGDVRRNARSRGVVVDAGPLEERVVVDPTRQR